MKYNEIISEIKKEMKSIELTMDEIEERISEDGTPSGEFHPLEPEYQNLSGQIDTLFSCIEKLNEYLEKDDSDE